MKCPRSHHLWSGANLHRLDAYRDCWMPGVGNSPAPQCHPGYWEPDNPEAGRRRDEGGAGSDRVEPAGRGAARAILACQVGRGAGEVAVRLLFPPEAWPPVKEPAKEEEND